LCFVPVMNRKLSVSLRFRAPLHRQYCIRYDRTAITIVGTDWWILTNVKWLKVQSSFHRSRFQQLMSLIMCWISVTAWLQVKFPDRRRQAKLSNNRSYGLEEDGTSKLKSIRYRKYRELLAKQIRKRLKSTNW
jgi:hypothetical protein